MPIPQRRIGVRCDVCGHRGKCGRVAHLYRDGLLFMAEVLYNASGLGLPIVMTVANRAIGAPINIWNDQSDSLSQRDSGWIQLYAQDNQHAVDLHLLAFRLAEELSTPVMVCMDGFVLTHAVERVDVPEQEQADAYLPHLRHVRARPGASLLDRVDGGAGGVHGSTLPSALLQRLPGQRHPSSDQASDSPLTWTTARAAACA